jgi:transaldolase
MTRRAVDTDNAVRAEGARHNPLVALVAAGQSIWLDYITRDLVRGGALKRLIEEDGIRGMTSNPTIFQKAIASGSAYDEQVDELLLQGKDAGAVFEALAVSDIQDACDLFRPLYDETGGADGFVSIEVSPRLAHDPRGTLDEARRLWQTVDRPNVMIKVPGTSGAVHAISALLRDGINVNVTLLFSLQSHERVMWAYIEALEARAAAGQPIGHLASVASFFVSRVDTLVDRLLDERIAAARDASAEEHLRSLKGKAAIANARLAYARFRAIFDGERFAKLRGKGAHVQRPLWASTGTKNPAYGDVYYVEALVGPDTVNTVPEPTLRAFQDHGQVRQTVDSDLGDARATMDALAQAGIDYDAVTQQLEDEGVRLFADSYDELLTGVGAKQRRVEQGAS